MNDEPFLRNHWSVVVSNTLTTVVAMAFGILVFATSGGFQQGEVYLGIFAAMFAVALVVNVIIWKKTKFYFLKDEIVVEKTTIFRSETRIQYDRLASVNVERDVICRLLGATKLSFNLNSSVNVGSAEAYIVLKADEAEKLRKEMDSRIFDAPSVAEDEIEPVEEAVSLVDVSVLDIFLHSFFSMPTTQFAFGILMLVYSVYSFVYGSSISLVSTILFVVEFFLPAVSSFFKLYGYRITRSGDAVSVSSGFFSTRKDSFLLSKVNFVKVREPLICRLMGRVVLEVEVVGTANSKGAPLLCPLKSKKVALPLLHELLPEFECTGKEMGQPRVSLVGIAMAVAVVLAATFAMLFVLSGYVPSEYHVYLNMAAVVVAVLCALWAPMAYRTRRFACDGNIVLLVTGAFDRVFNYILIDKIQFADVKSTPIQRRMGAARCDLNLLSTVGASTVTSGVFPAEELEEISSTVMARIRDGRYDFRRFQ